MVSRIVEQLMSLLDEECCTYDSEPHSANISRYVQRWFKIPYDAQLPPVKIVFGKCLSVHDELDTRPGCDKTLQGDTDTCRWIGYNEFIQLI
jgi:hypothetical protein